MLPTISTFTTVNKTISGLFAENYMPQNKKAKGQLATSVDRPRWDDVGPLVIVWPINIRSEYEKYPRYVLEANFPTEISK